MAASDDPLFLGLRGPSGREFRLEFKRGRSRRRGKEDVYILGTPDDPDINVAHPEFNDPNVPPIDATTIHSIYLRKGFEPIHTVEFGEQCYATPALVDDCVWLRTHGHLYCFGER